ncbi:MAG: ABC transporter ATP-binding protein [Rhodospirillales bacterium]|nr:ABC transporter ATP-binding protein [Rhodospirillales bacterium]
MSALSVAALTKRFGAISALADLSFDIADGEFFCVLGPTNAGKSTLLKTIAGLHKPDSGRITIAGRSVDALAPMYRNVSLLFQNIALFPTLKGRDNIAFPLRAAGVLEPEVARRVLEVAQALKVEHILDRYPRTFSGGERQRIAIGRAIARKADLLMLDEPLSNLDARIRTALRIEFKKLHRELRQAILYVTHDQAEAMSLSDRIAVLDAGRLQQIGTPDDVYHRPANRFVAGFIGTPPMNLLDTEVVQRRDVPTLLGDGFEIALPSLASLTDFPRLPRLLAMGVRPEDVRVAAEQAGHAPFAGEVVRVEHLGPKRILDIRLGHAVLKAVVLQHHVVRAAGPAWLGFVPLPHHVMGRESGLFFR